MVTMLKNDPLVQLLLAGLDLEDLRSNPMSKLGSEFKEIFSTPPANQTPPESPTVVLNSQNLFVLADFNLRTSGERALALLSTLAKVQDLLTRIREEIRDINTRRHKTSSTDGSGSPLAQRRAHTSERSIQALAEAASTLDTLSARLVSDLENASAALHQLRLLLKKETSLVDPSDRRRHLKVVEDPTTT